MTREIVDQIELAMTVGDIRAELDGMDDSMPVFFTVSYGDRTHTKQALPLSSFDVVPQSMLYETPYSESGVGVQDSHPDDDSELEGEFLLFE